MGSAGWGRNANNEQIKDLTLNVPTKAAAWQCCSPSGSIYTDFVSSEALRGMEIEHKKNTSTLEGNNFVPFVFTAHISLEITEKQVLSWVRPAILFYAQSNFNQVWMITSTNLLSIRFELQPEKPNVGNKQSFKLLWQQNPPISYSQTYLRRMQPPVFFF